jgi:hypothetical protein
MDFDFNPVKLSYYAMQPISSFVQEFSQNLSLTRVFHDFSCIDTLADYSVDELSDGNICIHIGIQGVSTYYDSPKVLYYICTATTFTLTGDDYSTDLASIVGSKKSTYVNKAISSAFSLTRAHLLMRFQNTANWSGYILPLMLIDDLIKKKKKQQDAE